ncbi:DNA topoisomerase IV subunit B [Citrobacter koseri]|uniref:DNA topoisomerase (ATP-hydrolyzing) n=1 Tax=Citrobacter koseri TaxID=545 RepID=A0A2X2WJ14_CITKO|nr:DNA topoisomerase IV subunit B [Citrobacter koseri]
MTQTYNADAIEVLTGLEPVRRRPGMYTDTTRPNHLGQEVIDNSVDEALAGHAKRVDVILHADQSLEVIDDGRGMPVDIHPEEGVPAVELILCRLHAGGKFSNKNYPVLRRSARGGDFRRQRLVKTRGSHRAS